MVRLERIRVHPVAALDGTSVQAVDLDGSGLAWDRRYAIVDRPPGSGSDDGFGAQYVDRNRERRIHDLETDYDLDRETVSVRESGADETHTFHLELDRDCFASWLSDYLGYPVELVRLDEASLPGDAASPEATIVGDATLERVASWVDGLDVEALCRRLRPNLVVGDAPAFWEDRLYDASERVVPVDIGSATLLGIGPCPVPPDDADIGRESDRFREMIAERRQATLPEWAHEARFDHYARLTAEALVSDSSRGETLSVGDTVSVGRAVTVPDPAD
ncbi:MOSC N-terminal beta barrel domain-containing protein [Haloterrigena alkaliphila]|uniref:MOSC N-terminal beta barrel domain-containing protein n=1 Tax=Haloterrigena alkaliphila TaxID=2816475 RepID=A0A8A2VDC3_9EURY|nr:MOSC N-terminal beta barrel domain-containing protein [Haloterrigena alkaliphila]QSW98710.1 MOSC N-terminal beta barrel domain-containing protein [Haloterrigena alkaliphila]